MKVDEIIKAYDDLVERVFSVAEKAGVYLCAEGDLPRLSIEGDDVVLTHKTSVSDGYGWYGTEDETDYLPLALLYMTDDDIKRWRTERKIEADKAEAARQEARRKEEIEAAFRQYQKLKKVFEK